MRKKNGSMANDPGAVIYVTIADPSRIVPMIARMAISHAIFRRSPDSIMRTLDSPRHVSLLIKSKIGRYIAMTMPPTTMPRIAIMIGSSSVSSPATAVSTSSS